MRSQLTEFGLVRAPDVDVRTRGGLLGALAKALAKTGRGPGMVKLGLEGKSDKVSFHFS